MRIHHFPCIPEAFEIESHRNAKAVAVDPVRASFEDLDDEEGCESSEKEYVGGEMGLVGQVWVNSTNRCTHFGPSGSAIQTGKSRHKMLGNEIIYASQQCSAKLKRSQRG